MAGFIFFVILAFVLLLDAGLFLSCLLVVLMAKVVCCCLLTVELVC